MARLPGSPGHPLFLKMSGVSKKPGWQPQCSPGTGNHGRYPANIHRGPGILHAGVKHRVGRFVVKIFYNDQVNPARAVLRKIRSGQVDLGSLFIP